MFYAVYNNDDGSLLDVYPGPVEVENGFVLLECEGDLPETLDHWDTGYRRFKTAITQLTKFDFMSRFTTNERVTIREAVAGDPILFDMFEMLKLAEVIDLGNPKTAQGVQYVEMMQYIATGRSAEILTKDYK